MSFFLCFLTAASLLGFAPQASEHFQKADAAVKAGDVKTAAAEYEAGLRLAPNAADAHNNLGAVYLQMEDYSHAVREFELAAVRDPTNLDYQFNLGFGLFHLDRCGEALQHLASSGQAPSHAADAEYIAGLCSYHLGRWNDAIKQIQDSIAYSTESPEKLYILIRAARKAQKPELAMKAFANLASNYPDSLFVHELLAEAYDLTKDLSAAEREFTRAIQLSPNEPGFNLDLGYLYWKKNRFDEAAAHFQRELTLDPRSSGSLYYLGVIALKEAKAAEALSLFRRALDQGGDYREAWIGVGEASEALNDLQTAEQSFRKAISFFPERVEPHYRLAQLLRKQGRTQEADAEFATVTQLHNRDQARAAAIFSSSAR